jgi:hypothetical protein
MNTAQTGWDWATITSGAGTDSITWTYDWGTDSLILGENFVCAVPLEDQAATTNSLGLGTPFAGNLEVYPVYRMQPSTGLEVAATSEVRMRKPPTVVRSVLFVPKHASRTSSLLDVSGRKVLELRSGANDVGRLAPGVYFVRQTSGADSAASGVTKVVVTR